MKLSGAEIIVKRLIANGTDTMFGYPGGAVLPLYDELYRYMDKINHILTAHEQGAAHAADGYARVTGKTGVVLATSGPGATNLVTGIANAYLDSIPLVAITGNVAVPLLGRDSFQEVDIVSITKSMTKFNYIVKDINELEDVLDKAFYIAADKRKGPVLIDVPKNIQTEVCEYKGYDVMQSNEIDGNHDLTDIIKAITNAERPFIYAGGGVISANAERELMQLSQKLSAPVGLSMMGLSALPDSYPLNLGMSGMHGKYASSLAKSESDVLIVLGARFSDRATGDVVEYSSNKTIIHIDIDHTEIGKNVTPSLAVCNCGKSVLTELLDNLPENANPNKDAWLSRIEELKQIGETHEDDSFAPKNVIQTVRKYCNDDTVVATDVGQHQMWVTQYYPFANPRTLLTSGGLGAMGYGLGAAIGGCIANGRKRTILFTGDGSFGMNLIELATAVSQNLPIIIIILNNNALGLPRQWQTTFYGGRYSQSTLNRETNFAELAKSFGATGYTTDNVSTLNEIMQSIENINAPVVIDFHISPDEIVLPMIPPGGSVNDIITKS